MSAIDLITHEARELVDAYERCKWLEQFQPQGDLTSYELEHLETLSNDVHYAFWNNKRRIALIEQMTNQLAAVTKERDELREMLSYAADWINGEAEAWRDEGFTVSADESEMEAKRMKEALAALQPGDSA